MPAPNDDFRFAFPQPNEADKRLISRYYNRLLAVDPATSLPPHMIYYAAASAAECLRLGHDDAAAIRTNGGSLRAVEAQRRMAARDAEFYLDMAREWIKTGKAPPAA